MNLMNTVHFWKPLVEVLILWSVIYHIMLFFEGTRAIQVLRGIVLVLLAFFLFQFLGLDILNWLLTKLFALSVLALLIIFQPEIRQGLARLGQRNIFGSALREEDLDCMLREIGKSVESLARDKHGALIAIEKDDPLTAYIESGVLIDSRVSSDLIQAIFTPNNPLHDGGMVVRQGRIAVAGCWFPLSQNQDLSRIFGTRHRAAIGLSEENNALIIVVSEERQDISLVYRGRLYKDLGREELVSKIKEIIKSKRENA